MTGLVLFGSRTGSEGRGVPVSEQWIPTVPVDLASPGRPNDVPDPKSGPGPVSVFFSGLQPKEPTKTEVLGSRSVLGRYEPVSPTVHGRKHFQSLWSLGGVEFWGRVVEGTGGWVRALSRDVPVPSPSVRPENSELKPVTRGLPSDDGRRWDRATTRLGRPEGVDVVVRLRVQRYEEEVEALADVVTGLGESPQSVEQESLGEEEESEDVLYEEEEVFLPGVEEHQPVTEEGCQVVHRDVCPPSFSGHRSGWEGSPSPWTNENFLNSCTVRFCTTSPCS